MSIQLNREIKSYQVLDKKYSRATNSYDTSCEGNMMTKALKDYKDEYLTGLTEDEKKEIEEEVKNYLKKHGSKTKANKTALDNFVKSLLKKYGFKGDLEACLGDILTDSVQDEYKVETNKESKKVIQEANAAIRYADYKFAYGDNMCSSLAAKTRLLEEDKDREDKQGKVFEKFPSLRKDEEEKTLSKVVVRSDGTRMLLIIKNATVVNQFNLGKKELEE